MQYVVGALTLERAGRVDEARSARELAVGLTADPAVRRHLLRAVAP